VSEGDNSEVGGISRKKLKKKKTGTVRSRGGINREKVKETAERKSLWENLIITSH